MVDINRALAANRDAVVELIAAADRSAGAWTTPRAPGKWSPSQIVEHVARSIDESANLISGAPSKFPTLPFFIRPVARTLLFNRVLRNSAFPKAKTNKAMDPESGSPTPAEARRRLEAALARFERECRACAQGSGIVASGAFGPRRARYGGVRDLIIGVSMIRADGVVAKGGGKVVKNVAGFDLPKVACGSLGTLGMIASATFRLHPLPEASATVRFDGLTPERVFALVRAAREAQLEPASVVALSGDSLAFRFEGFAKGVSQQTERMLALGGERDDGSFWPRHDAIRTGGALRIRIAALPSQIAEVHEAIAPLDASFAWYATLGLGFAAGDVDDVDAATRAIVDARKSFSVIVEKAPMSIDPWGKIPNSFKIMEQLKLRFDPERHLNPGRFAGGL
jgi:FAD/FMN-containing dehydrogenase